MIGYNHKREDKSMHEKFQMNTVYGELEMWYSGASTNISVASVDNVEVNGVAYNLRVDFEVDFPKVTETYFYATRAMFFDKHYNKGISDSARKKLRAVCRDAAYNLLANKEASRAQKLAYLRDKLNKLHAERDNLIEELDAKREEISSTYQELKYFDKEID